LWDLAIQNPPVKVRENTYEIRNVFQWKPDFGSAYDLYFELSPKHGYLPRLIKILDRTLDGSVPTTSLLEREVNRFAKVNGLDFPVDFTFRIGKTVERTVLAQDSLVINESFTKGDFALQMPTDNWYYDSRTKTRFDPKVIESEKPSWILVWWIAGTAIVACLVVVCLKLRKRILAVGLLAVCATSLGCGKNLTSRQVSDRPSAHSEQSSVSLARPVLEINNGLPIQVRIPIQQREGKVVFPIKNLSGFALTFNSDVSVTCGCTRARLDPLVIGPNEEAIVEAVIDNLRTPIERNVQLGLSTVLPQKEEFQIPLVAIFEGDWHLNTQHINLVGLYGTTQHGKLVMHGSPEIINEITLRTSPEVKLLEIDDSSNETRTFDVASTISSVHINSAVGSVYCESSKGEPSTVEVVVSQRAIPIGKWIPIAVVVPPDECRDSVLRVADGYEVLRVHSSDADCKFVSKTGSDYLYQVTRRDTAKSDINASVEATVGNGTVEQVIKLLVRFQAQKTTGLPGE
jgi:hypothetical protein